jgi:Flp pilus assembly pilin Flp
MATHSKWLQHQFIEDESGQGITEYSSIIAFVSVLVVLVFSLAKGQLSQSISGAFSAVSGQINNLAAGGP